MPDGVGHFFICLSAGVLVAVKELSQLLGNARICQNQNRFSVTGQVQNGFTMANIP